MSYLLTQILVCLLIAGLIGLAIGWLLRGGCSTKLKENDEDWDEKISSTDLSWKNKIQALMTKQESDIQIKNNELLTIKDTLILSQTKYKDLNSQNEQLLLQLKEQKIDFNTKTKSDTLGWESKVQGLISQSSSEQEKAEKTLFLLKKQLSEAEAELKKSRGNIEKNNTTWKLKLTTKANELKVKEEALQSLISQESDNKNKTNKELNELRSQLFTAQTEAGKSKEAIKKANSEWSFKVKSREENLKNHFTKELNALIFKLKAKEFEFERKTKITEAKIQSLIIQESNTKVNGDKKLNELKTQLFKAQSEVKSNKDALDKSNNEWNLKIKKVEASSEKSNENQNKIELLEKQLQQEKYEATTAKNKLFSSNKEFNQNLEKIKKEYRQKETEAKENKNALNKNNNDWKLKLQALENDLKHKEEAPLFNLKRNSHKTKAKGKHIQRVRKQHVSTTEVSEEKEETKSIQTLKPTTASLKTNKDNLQLIKGVGKVLEKILNEHNIYQFQQIANWNKDEVTAVNKALSFSGRIEREEWIAQANELALGKETEFSKRVIKGDVPTSRK